MIIYKITNKVNGKVYIGQTIHSLEARWKRHLKCARDGVDTHLYQAIRKYGEENFIHEIICEAKTKNELNILETYYIQEYDSIHLGYNMVDGGNNNVMFIPEVKQHHADVVRSESNRKKISEGMKRKIARGEFFTPEHRRKLSEKAKQRVYPKNSSTKKKTNRGYINVKRGDTRSIGCYCILEDGSRIDFHSYRDAWMWWKNIKNPFKTDAECVYQRKIKQSIDLGYFTYCNNGIKYEYPKWFKGGDLDDKEVGKS